MATRHHQHLHHQQANLYQVAVQEKLEDDTRKVLLPCVWALMPQELVETVLLFLPSSSQARFRCVCKRWKEVMSSAAFQEQSSLIPCPRPQGWSICILRLPGNTRRLPLKARKLDFPGCILPNVDCSSEDNYWRVASHGDLVAAAYWSVENREQVRCWLLNLDDGSFQELPPLLLPERFSRFCKWGISVRDVGGGTLVEVSFYSWNSKYTSFHTYCGISTSWHTVSGVGTLGPWTVCSDVTSGLDIVQYPDEHGIRMTYLREPGKEPSSANLLKLPEVPDSKARLFSSCSTLAVFAYSVDMESSQPLIKLYRLDYSRRQWEWVASQSLPQRNRLKYHGVEHGRMDVSFARVVGNTVLLLVYGCALPSLYIRYCHILAYHILDGSCKWLHPELHPEELLHWLDNPASLAIEYAGHM